MVPGWRRESVGSMQHAPEGSLPSCVTGMIVLLGVMAVDPAWAAVRVCSTDVTSEVTSAVRERDAKLAAIRDWTRKAKSVQIPHPSWRIASLKVVTCVPNDGHFDCVAYATACTIKQTPPRRPRKQSPQAVDT